MSSGTQEKSYSERKRVDEELKKLKKLHKVQDNAITKGTPHKNTTTSEEQIQTEKDQEMSVLHENLNTDKYATKMHKRQQRAIERKAARARGEEYSSSEEETILTPVNKQKRGSAKKNDSTIAPGPAVCHTNEPTAPDPFEDLEEANLLVPDHTDGPNTDGPKKVDPADESAEEEHIKGLADHIPPHSRKESLAISPDNRSLPRLSSMQEDHLAGQLEDLEEANLLLPDVVDDESSSESSNESNDPVPNFQDEKSDPTLSLETNDPMPNAQNAGRQTRVHAETKVNSNLNPAAKDLVKDIVDSEYNKIIRQEGKISNEMELEALTLLEGYIGQLELKVKQLHTSAPSYVVDTKMLLILRTLKNRFTTHKGKTLLKREAKKYHNGNIFDAEESFIHTFKQSLLLRMEPPTAKQYHQRKNNNLIET